MRIDTTAASRTPFRIPSTSTPANATMATLKSKRLTRHNRAISRMSIKPFTATSTMAASTALGRFCTSPVRKSRQSASVAEAKTSASGVCAPAFSFTADCDNPPATG